MIRNSTVRNRGKNRREWLVPLGLILLSLVPTVGGSFRLAELANVVEIDVLPDSERIASAPIPVVIHIISVLIYSLLGAFQFVPRLRRSQPGLGSGLRGRLGGGWHRAAGRILIPSGIVGALSGLWMNQFSPLPWYDNGPLYWVRLLVGGAMLLSIILGTIAIRRRNFAQHGAWMMRGYALALGAGTQVFSLLPWMLFPSIQSELTRAILMSAGWLLNLLVAEWVIYRRRKRLPGGSAVTISGPRAVANVM